jgi:hypothetical protein
VRGGPQQVLFQQKSARAAIATPESGSPIGAQTSARFRDAAAHRQVRVDTESQHRTHDRHRNDAGRRARLVRRALSAASPFASNVRRTVEIGLIDPQIQHFRDRA